MGNKRSVIGAFLILLGVLIGVGNLFAVEDAIVLPIISMILFFIYFYFGGIKRRGNIGFLIPGAILGAVGIFAVMQTNNMIAAGDEPIILIMMGGAFLVVLFLHTIRLSTADWGERFWPVFPASFLIILGAVVLMITTDNALAEYVVPGFLILFGLYMLLRPLLKPKKKKLDL